MVLGMVYGAYLGIAIGLAVGYCVETASATMQLELEMGNLSAITSRNCSCRCSAHRI